MPHFLLTVLRPSTFRPEHDVTQAMRRAIDSVNEAMVADGIRRWVGGLQRPTEAVRVGRDGLESHAEERGRAAEADLFADGLWIVEVPSLEEAVAWAGRAAQACQAEVEVRAFH